jgi:hypothetical protein
MTRRRRADGLDPDSREARRADGYIRFEVQFPKPDFDALEAFAQCNGLTRSAALLKLVRFGPPADPFEREPE